MKLDKDWPPSANTLLQFFVAAAIMGLVFFCVGCVARGSLKADSAVVGSAFTILIILVNFCFPGSVGTQKQADTINRLAVAQVAPLTTTTTETIDNGSGQGTDVAGAGPGGVGAGGASVNGSGTVSATEPASFSEPEPSARE